MTLSPSSFCKRYRSSYETPSSSSSPASSPTLPSWKRYRGTSELIEDTKIESDESEDEGTDSEDEETSSESQQQQDIPAEDIVKDEPLGLSYKAARRRALERAGDNLPSTYEVGQSSRSTPDQQTETAGETPTQTYARMPTRTTWEDPEDVGTPASPEWIPLSPPVSPVIPSLIASPAPTLALDEGHEQSVRRSTHSVSGLGVWNEYRSRLGLLLDIYEDQWDICDLRRQHAANQWEMHELKDRIATLE
ncbi:hypothetical protein Tco_0109391 [Tanacetum coccineum]